MLKRRSRRVHVLVCGERERGDDAAALLAADGLTDLPALVEIHPVGQLEPNDLLDLPEGDACLVVDALVGLPPGTIVCGSLASLLEDVETAHGKTAAGASGKSTGSASRRPIGTTDGKTITLGSSHSIAPAEVMGLVRELRGELPVGSYVGVGASSFELGASVSAPVAAAVHALREAILQEARRLVGLDVSSG